MHHVTHTRPVSGGGNLAPASRSNLPPAETVAEMRLSGMSAEQIGAQYGVSGHAVRNRLRAAGIKVPRYKQNPRERFWAKVDKNGPIPEYAPHLGPCWIWTSCDDGHSYGAFHLNGNAVKAHRYSYELAGGTLIDGLELDHLCRVTMCVNPDHLEQVTGRVNMLRGTAPAAVHAQQIECIRGHVFDEMNTYITKTGSRRCRSCALIYYHERQAKRGLRNFATQATHIVGARAAI